MKYRHLLKPICNRSNRRWRSRRSENHQAGSALASS